MDKEQILTKIQDCGIVAVVRAESADQASRIADACIEGGVAAIELTFTVPHADKVIEELAKRYTPEQMILGAGTVMDAPTARIAMLSGANFVVSPYFDPETVKMCNRYRVAVMPGIMTVKEAVAAMENEVLYEPADLVIREGGYDCGAKSEAAAQSARDIVFSAAFPSGERSRILYSARARIEAEHYLTERYFIKHAILGSFEFKLHKLYFLSCRIY